MRNRPPYLHVPADQPIPPSRTAAFHRGWIDAQNGREHDPDLYPDKKLQGIYENGRLAVLNVMRAGPVPLWNGDEATFERVVWRRVERAARAIGPAIPGKEV